MRNHIVLRQLENLVQIHEESQRGQRPRTDFILLQEKVDSSICLPSFKPSAQDSFSAMLEGKPENWALARKLAAELNEENVIYCASEDAGIPVASLCGANKSRPRIVSFFHNFIRPRGLTSTQLFQVARSIDLFLVCSTYQGDFLRRYLNIPESRVRFVWDKVDHRFFTPGPPSSDKRRPIIASVGREKRDYRLIAAATQDMDVDVRISGYSPHAKQSRRSFPKVFPSNMTSRTYSYAELAQLYRDADIVIVSIFENSYAAGVTSLLEAMATKRPIIATKTKGLASYLDSDLVISVEPGDVKGLKQAIGNLLSNPDEAKERVERAYQMVVKRHAIEIFVDVIAECMSDVYFRENKFSD